VAVTVISTTLDSSIIPNTQAFNTLSVRMTEQENLLSTNVPVISSLVATAASNTVRQDTLETTFNGLIINAGSSNAEIVAARGSEAYLPDRLTKVDTQLAENASQLTLKATVVSVSTKAEKSYVDAFTSASPGQTYATLVALQTALTASDGKNHVVTEDGKLYSWVSGAWTAGGVYQSLGIALGAVDKSNLNNELVDALPVPYISNDVALSITDKDGKRSWLEIDNAGKPTDNSKSILASSLNTPTINPIPNTSFAMTDQNGVISDLELGMDGHFSNRVIALLTQRFLSPSSISAIFDTITKSDLHVLSCWGDSITEGGSPGAPWPTTLQTLVSTRTTVNNYGISGQMSGTIGARQGGVQIACVVTGGSILATTATVNVTITPSAGDVKNLNGDLLCSLMGIPGDLVFSGTSAATFARTIAGTATVVPDGTLAIPSQGLGHEGDLVIIWVGRNDIAFCYPYQSLGPIAVIAGMIAHLNTQLKRFVIISTLTTNAETTGTDWYNRVMEINNSSQTLYPNNYLDIRRYLIDNGLTDALITPTADDLTLIAGDTIPSSLSYDGIHPNDIAKGLITKQVYKFINQKGWSL